MSSIGPMFLILTDLSSSFINIFSPLGHSMGLSLASRLDLWFSKFVNLEQSFKQRFEFVQRELGRRVAERHRRVVVDFHEQSVNAAGHSGARQMFDEFRLSAGRVAQSAGQLLFVGGAEDERVSQPVHDPARAQLNYRV